VPVSFDALRIEVLYFGSLKYAMLLLFASRSELPESRTLMKSYGSG
jgi:hypothetical protein